jgi:hypothetical protein
MNRESFVKKTGIYDIIDDIKVGKLAVEVSMNTALILLSYRKTCDSEIKRFVLKAAKKAAFDQTDMANYDESFRECFSRLNIPVSDEAGITESPEYYHGIRFSVIDAILRERFTERQRPWPSRFFIERMIMFIKVTRGRNIQYEFDCYAKKIGYGASQMHDDLIAYGLEFTQDGRRLLDAVQNKYGLVTDSGGICSLPEGVEICA